MSNGLHDHAWYKHSLTLIFGCELIGTFLLTFVIEILVATATNDVLVPLGIGALLLSLCNIFGDLSGAHFNPSVTLAIYGLLWKQSKVFSLVRCLVYLAAELLGAVGGLVVAIYCTAGRVSKNPFSVKTRLATVDWIQILVCEVLFTYIMTLTCLRCSIATTSPHPSTALWVAGAVVAASYAGGPISGACMNPALAFAFALVLGDGSDLLTYTLGPAAGCLLAVLTCLAINPQIWRDGVLHGDTLSQTGAAVMEGAFC